MVAICLDPKSLSEAILSQLADIHSNVYCFSEERKAADIVVSNIDEVMFEVLEGDGQEFIQVSPTWGDESAILSLLKRKFNLS